MIDKKFLLDIVRMQIEETERLRKLGSIEELDEYAVANDLHKQ